MPERSLGTLCMHTQLRQRAPHRVLYRTSKTHREGHPIRKSISTSEHLNPLHFGLIGWLALQQSRLGCWEANCARSVIGAVWSCPNFLSPCLTRAADQYLRAGQQQDLGAALRRLPSPPVSHHSLSVRHRASQHVAYAQDRLPTYFHCFYQLHLGSVIAHIEEACGLRQKFGLG